MTRLVSIDELAASIRPGERVYLPGSAGEPTALLDRLCADPERTRGLEVLTTAIPGINRVRVDDLHETATVTGLFMQPGLRAAQASGRFRHLPMSFSGFVEHVRSRYQPRTCLVQVSAPDADGRCSLGPAVEFTPLVEAKSGRTLAVINARTPKMPGAASISLARIALAAEVDEALPGYVVGPASPVASLIAKRIAPLVEDGTALQVGLGKVPDALFPLLHDRRRLRLHSGMLSDGALDLAEAGALDPGFRHTSCVWVGTPDLYERLRDRPEFSVLGCDVTHDLAVLAGLGGFLAVNSALSVDLFGQANLEHAGGRAVSGVGGALDFASAARASAGGLSIVALPACLEGGARSRIVPRLGDGLASLPRTAIDLVVTEHGVADLRGLSVHERAEALVAVAAPSFRDTLTSAWREMRSAL